VLRQRRTERDLFGGAADGWLFIPADADPAARLGVRFDLRALGLALATIIVVRPLTQWLILRGATLSREARLFIG
jgi:hypothetical protein